MAKNHVMLLLFLFAAAGEVAGTNHIVGKSFGWSIPRNASFYQDWAAPRTFYVGDKLVFLYASGMHNVIEVSKEDYDACTQKDTITIHFSGPTILRITKPGDHYFICGLRRHCFGGQKLNITAEQDPAEMGSVAAAASSFPTSFSLLLSVLSIFLLFMFL